MHKFSNVRTSAAQALTTVILAVGEIDGELRSAVLEYTHEHRNVALATCMHINFGRLMFRLGATVYKIGWIPFFLFVARFGFCRQFDGFAVRPLRHFSSGVHRSALSLVMWSLGNAYHWWAGLLAADWRQSRSQTAW